MSAWLSWIFGSFIFVLSISISSGQTKTTCSAYNCKLPNCRCAGVDIPGSLEPAETPQMVLLAFDDAVNWENWEFYERLFPPDGRRMNPNGCPMSMSLFVWHQYTDYCMIQKLYLRGMEMGVHSVTHRVPHWWWSNASRDDILFEANQQRAYLTQLGGVPFWDIHGWRSPFIQPTGDTLYEVLYNTNFTYDSSLTYPWPDNLRSPILWPYTLDHPYHLVCNILPCPKGTYPGFWVVPVVCVMDYLGTSRCAYSDSCNKKAADKEQASKMLWQNFERSYTTNRAPFYINVHSRWLEERHNLDALDEFLERLDKDYDDVYLVTYNQALEWVRNPTPLSKIQQFKPWQCEGVLGAEAKATCQFTVRPKKNVSSASPTVMTYPPDDWSNTASGSKEIVIETSPPNGQISISPLASMYGLLGVLFLLCVL